MGLFDKIKNQILNSNGKEDEVNELKETVILKGENLIDDEVEYLKYLLKQLKNEKDKNNINIKIQNKIRGDEGEQEILRKLELSTVPKYVIRDLYLEIGDFTAQIDFLVITKNRIYEIESKNNSGNAQIKENGEIHITTSNKSYKMESPVNQVLEHKGVLNRIIQSKQDEYNLKYDFLKLYKPLVVISNKKTSIDVTKASESMKNIVIPIDNLMLLLEEESNLQDYNMSKDEIKELSEFLLDNHKKTAKNYLKKYEKMPKEEVKPKPKPKPKAPVIDKPQSTIPDKKIDETKTKTENVKSNKKIYCDKCGSEMKEYEDKRNYNNGKPYTKCSNAKICEKLAPTRPTCPKHKTKMVVRTNSKTGKQFYACEQYCKYTVNIGEL